MTSTIIQYTEDDVKNMTNHELVIEFDKVEFGQRIRQSTLIKKNPILFNEIRNRTLFLDDVFSQKNIQVPILSRIFCLAHNIIEYPKCKSPTCDNLVSWNSSKFCDYCCRTCSNSSPDVQNKKKSTCNKNFGVDNPFQSLQVRNIAKETLLKNLGVDNPSKSEIVKNKVRQTHEARYGGIGFASEELKERILRRNNDIYKVPYPMMLKSIQEKAIQTNLLKRGVMFASQCEIVKEKIRNTNIRIRGVDNVFKSDEIKQKIRNTNIEKLGVPYPAQSSEYHKNAHKKYTNPKYPGITFGSRWEFKVYDFFKEQNIEFKYQLEPIPYEYDGKTYYYIPDFLVNGRIYEVKGDMFFRINETTGKEEMFCPYGRKKLGEEKWNWLCGKYEAKHQCMIRNNVIVLRELDISNISKYKFV